MIGATAMSQQPFRDICWLVVVVVVVVVLAEWIVG